MTERQKRQHHVMVTGSGLMRTQPLLSAVAQVVFGASIIGGLALLFFLGILLNVPFVSFMIIFVGMPALVALYWVTYILRQVQSRMVLMYLEQAARLGFPLPNYLESGARSESPLLSMRLNALARDLRMGIPLGVAVAQRVPEIPFRQACLIAAGENAGRLRDTLSRLLRQEESRTDYRQEHTVYYRTYLFIVVGGMSFLLMFMFIFVVPKFREIFNDFRVSLPALTEWVLHITSVLVESGLPWLILIALVLGLLMTVGSVVHRVLLPGWAPVSDLLMLRRLSWYVPVWHQIEHYSGIADICETMAESAKAGMPVEKMFNQADALVLNPVLHERLRRWRDLTLAGDSLSDAARYAHLPAMVPGILATAKGENALARSFEFLGHAYRAKFSHVWVLLQGIGQPLVVLFLGIIVGTFVLAFFLPLVKLIASVAVYPEYL